MRLAGPRLWHHSMPSAVFSHPGATMNHESRSDRFPGFTNEPAKPPRGIVSDHMGGLLGISAVDSNGMTRFRLYVFNDTDARAATESVTELLDKIDPPT